jgi:predicted DNA-binding protein YlxM (UPF0122 family)
MKTFNTSRELLLSNSVGIGKTDSLPEIASLEAGKLTYSGHTVDVTQVWQESYLLMALHTKLKDLTPSKQIELLNAYSENRLALTHKFDSFPVVKSAIKGHYKTSDELLSSYFALVSAETVQDLFNLLLTVKDGMSKDTILSIVQSAKDMIVSPAQLQAVSALEAKEKGLILGRNTLETAGCFDVSFTSDKQIKCSVPFVKADTLPALVSETLKHVPSLDKLGAGCLVMSFDVINQEG